MSKITDYAFLFQKSFGTSGVNAIGSFQLSQLNSSSVQSKLKAAGINTNSKQYKAAVKQMMSAGNGAMYGNIQGIKNLMSHYDKDGDYINPVNGLAGLLVTDENESSRKRIILIPDSSKEEMYELAKKEFLNENGTLNGDTTKRESVYNNLYRKMDKDDRLSAGWTMEQYEHQYRQAFAEAAKAADPTWRAGKPIPAGALDGITREYVESGKKSVDIKI
ncbi:hypothetical protein DW996_12690 [Roseburia sp. AM51-8]|uniref:DUF3879 family protein n=1 Tax=Roseburia sp. AM51-8 TaxID=2292366 RepID=UPI000E53F606|nr:DUF3879 family protein [Roseburia sp. AM51-8]RHP98795.1 hypothetical protein DW996_12690 [Roseburia sp. AM51-8]